MSKTIYVIIGVIILLIIIGVVVMQRNANNTTIIEETETTEEFTDSQPVDNTINQDEATNTLASPDETAPASTDTDSTTSQTSTVTYTANGFSPATLTVKKGTSVTFTNNSDGSMWVASDPHPTHTELSGFDAKRATNSYSFTFNQAGTFGYHNHLDPTDTGTIIVQ